MKAAGFILFQERKYGLFYVVGVLFVDLFWFFVSSFDMQLIIHRFLRIEQTIHQMQLDGCWNVRPLLDVSFEFVADVLL
jgi:hypothetical protein